MENNISTLETSDCFNFLEFKVLEETQNLERCIELNKGFLKQSKDGIIKTSPIFYEGVISDLKKQYLTFTGKEYNK